MLYSQFCESNDICDLTDIEFMFYCIHEGTPTLILGDHQDLFYEDDCELVESLTNLSDMPNTVWINVN
jgi:hypothetical protein